MNTGIVAELGIASIAAAGLYGLVAMGVVLAYVGSATIHLAIGQVALAGGLVAATVYGAGTSVGLSIVLGLLVGGALSALAERGLVEPTRGRPMLGAVLLLGGGVVLWEVLVGIFPQPAYAFPTIGHTFHVGTALVRVRDLVDLGVALLVAVVGLVVLQFTPVGVMLRLTSSAPDAAERIGVRTTRMRGLAFAIAGVLATAAVLLGVADFPLAVASSTPSAVSGLPLALRGIAAAAAGGMRSTARALGAALAIGTVQAVGDFKLGSGGEALADAASVLLIVAGWPR
jgi:branched-subunit amino acid ABC-type transport system permease component